MTDAPCPSPIDADRAPVADISKERCVYLRTARIALTVVTDADGPAQGPRVDQNCNHRLCHADQREQEKFGIIE